MNRVLTLALAIAVPLAVPLAARAADAMKYELLAFPHSPGEAWTSVKPDAAYDASVGHGYEAAHAAGEPFRFSARVPEGNYRVTLTLGSPTAKQASTITVKSETRRLHVEKLRVEAGQTATRSFIVNVRTAALPGGGQVRLNDREKNAPHWDDKLTLEFLGENPVVSGVEIDPADGVPTVYLAGDSTVTDQPSEPWGAWGQMLPRFVRNDVAVANHAESGRSVSSFYGDRRFPKILGSLKPGDFVLVQFGHNDQKENGPGKGPFANFAEGLKRFAGEVRAKGATPVLLTPMHRRRFDAQGKVQNSFGDYPAATRQVAKDEKLTLLDLNAISATFYEALGPDASTKAFVFYPANAFPGQTEAIKDNTHHSNYGAYELARCVVELIRKSDDPKLRAILADDVGTFDPSKPDDPAIWDLPRSLATSTTKPAGS